jgi:hypothetical protein
MDPLSRRVNRNSLTFDFASLFFVLDFDSAWLFHPDMLTMGFGWGCIRDSWTDGKGSVAESESDEVCFCIAIGRALGFNPSSEASASRSAAVNHAVLALISNDGGGSIAEVDATLSGLLRILVRRRFPLSMECNL